MSKIIGVNFRNVGKVYYFDPGELEFRIGDHVIVETSRGIEYGKVVLPPTEMEESHIKQPLREVTRAATPEDDARAAANHQKEREAYQVCVKKIREHNLEMKLIDVEYSFDNNKILFYFTADGRIDFRQLVKDLASIFKTRIELRQIGVRDETKILGGIGICGRPLCCHTWLSDFVPVSIRMAKEQNLSLNQTKISGVCGRLMCCLKNEQETYEELNSRLPGQGDYVTMPDGQTGTVHSVNVLRQTVKVAVEEEDQKEILEYPVDELEFTPRGRRKGKGGKDGRRQEKDGAGQGQEKQAEGGREKGQRQNKERRNADRDRSQRDGQKGEGKTRGERPEKGEGRGQQPSSKERGETPEKTEGRGRNERRRRNRRRNTENHGRENAERDGAATAAEKTE